jgi:hypothetical protein
LTRQAIGWPHPPFEVPAEVYAGWDARPRGAVLERDWNGLFARYAAQFPAEAAEFERRMRGDLPARFADVVADTVKAAFAKKETVATRKASQLALDVLAEAVPEMIGGSADLTGSNLTKWSKATNLRSTGHRQFNRRPERAAVHRGSPHQLWRARVRHERHCQRHGAARRTDPVCRHLPHVLRLQPQCAAHGGADEAARDLRLHA